jgi:hypothetical protein
MPVTVTTYLCKLCGSQFRTYDEATHCETEGMPSGEPLNVGDAITFDLEDYTSGGGASLESTTAKVEARIILTVGSEQAPANKPIHMWAYLVRRTHHEAHIQDRIVLSTPDGLTSPGNCAFRPGYIEALRQDHTDSGIYFIG